MDIDYDSNNLIKLVPEMQDISLLLKDLIKRMLAPVEKRIKIDQIFTHPWMRVESKRTKLNIEYSSMISYSKFSKLKQITANYLAM